MKFDQFTKKAAAASLAALLTVALAACGKPADKGGAPSQTTQAAASETQKAAETKAAETKAAETQKAEETKAPSAAADTKSEGLYKDGQYEATAVGYSGGLKVRVTIKGGRIDKIEVVKHNEVGKQYYEAAIRDVPKLIIEKQTTEGIHAVSGSTMTSKGIIKAVDKALKKAAK